MSSRTHQDDESPATLREAPGLLLQLVERAVSPVAIFDTQMRYLVASASWRHMGGLPAEVRGKSHYALVPDEPAHWRELHARCLAGAEETLDEQRWNRADGSVLWLCWQGQPWRSATGEIGGLIVQAELRSELKQAEAAQLRAEQALDRARLMGLASRINEIELVMRLDGTLVHVNDRAVAAYGYARSELEGMHVRRLRQVEAPDIVTQQIAQARQQGIRFEAVHVRKDGSHFPVEVSSRPFVANGVRYLHSLVRDLTEQRRSEQELRGLVTELQNALQHVTTLKGLLPICMHCRKVRDDAGYWSMIETYFRKHSELMFSHGVCPDCAKQHYPELNED
jgi:PAS domain S-box-containing protein